MSRIRLFLAALIVAASLSGSAMAGWGFSYHSYVPHYDYHCHGPVCAPSGGYIDHYYAAPYVAPYVPHHHHHWHGPPRGAFFFGF